jgi:hypothetical protein
MGRPGEHEDEPMLNNGFYLHGKRPERDAAWKWTYVLSLVLCTVGGVYAWTHRNRDFSTLISADYLSDPSHCPSSVGPSRRLLTSDDDEDFNPTYFMEAVGLASGVSVLGGILLGLLSLYLYRSKPHAMVGVSVGLQVLLPAAAGIAIVASGGGGASLPLFITAGIIGFVFYLYREQLALVGRLLSISSHALYDNPSIVWGSLGLQFLGFVLVLPLLAFVILAYANGGVVPNSSVAQIQGKICIDDQGNEVLCCAWMPDGWAVAYMSFGSVMLGWTSLLVFTIKVFVISGVTAQWYFAPAMQKPRGTLLKSFRHALGPQFGSLCLASWLLNLLNMLKSMAENARTENRNNIFVQLLVSCFEFLITLLETVTKFAVVKMAITGDAMMDSCRSTADLLARNLLDTVGVWWFPGMILQVSALLLSGVWGLAVGSSSYLYWGSNKAALSSGIAMGVVAFFLGLLALCFINSILLNIVDAVYICFAMDRDAHACTRLEVHEVYSLLPSNKAPGGVVENPDGNYAFGAAPASAAAAGSSHAYAPPQVQQQHYPHISTV